MKARTKGVLFVCGFAATAAVALPAALTKVIDPYRYCETGFSNLIDCSYHWSSTTTSQSDPVVASLDSTASGVPSEARGENRPASVDVTAWAVAECPGNEIAMRLLCAAPPETASVQSASDDLATGLPRPRPWLLTTAKNSPSIEAIHIETPLDLGGVLRFYRVELTKRGWTENGDAVEHRERAAIVFTTPGGLALLRLTRHNDRTIVDLSRRKLVNYAGILPKPGLVRLLLGNDTDEEVILTVNGRITRLSARAGAELLDDAETGTKSQKSEEIELPPGKYQATLRIAKGSAQNREFEVAANETWGLLASSKGVPIPLRLY